MVGSGTIEPAFSFYLGDVVKFLTFKAVVCTPDRKRQRAF